MFGRSTPPERGTGSADIFDRTPYIPTPSLHGLFHSTALFLMDSSDSASPHTLIANVSGLFGIVIFLQQMWNGATLDHVLLVVATSGLAAYLTLAVGYAAARRIIATPPSGTSDDSSETAPEQAADADPDDSTNSPEPQAA